MGSESIVCRAINLSSFMDQDKYHLMVIPEGFDKRTDVSQTKSRRTLFGSCLLQTLSDQNIPIQAESQSDALQ